MPKTEPYQKIHNRITNWKSWSCTKWDREVKNKPHLRFDDSVHYCLQGLVPTALHNPLKVLWAVQESLGHGDVQIIVGLFSSQVLHTHPQH